MKLLSLFKKKIDGYLITATSDLDEPYLFVELVDDVSKIYNKKYVTFEVKAQNSQK